MKAIAIRVWRGPTSGLSRLASALLDLAFAWRIIRIQRLRWVGRYREADRVLRAVQREFDRQRRS